MRELVTEQDLARARSDAAFRQQLMASSLERLLEALKQMRQAEDGRPGIGPPAARRRRSRGQARRPPAENGVIGRQLVDS